jgi:hypothetical protein
VTAPGGREIYISSLVSHLNGNSSVSKDLPVALTISTQLKQRQLPPCCMPPTSEKRCSQQSLPVCQRATGWRWPRSRKAMILRTTS